MIILKSKQKGEKTVTFGERLCELRKSKNISQEELAELLDVSRQSISKWENDKAYPEMTRLLFMSDYFDISLDHLMRGVEVDDNKKEEHAIHYTAKNMLMVWNSFVSNLTDKQRKLMMILYFLVACTMVAILVTFIYGAGYVIGQLIGNIKNDFNL